MVRRGYVASDAQEFASVVLPRLKKAGAEVSYLIDRGYSRDTAISFVGNHYQFTERQRLLLARSVSGDIARTRREEKCLALDNLQGKSVVIDGFNTVITLEVALSKSLVVRGQDHTVRDLAGLHGTYRLIDKTPQAINLILSTLEVYGTDSAKFLFDKQVSNSGQVASLVRSLGENYAVKVSAETCENVDAVLSGLAQIVTSDSVILDACDSWFNLLGHIVDDLQRAEPQDVFVLNLFSSDESY